MSEHTVLDHVDEYLKLGREYGSSDLHLATAYPPAWRLNGVLGAIWPDHEPLKPEETEKLVRSFLGEKEWSRLDERGDIDFAYEGSDGRYRASIVKQRLGYDMVFRIINSEIRSMEDIGLPIEHIIPLTRYQNGLILVTGSVGSGKSTSLASIVDFINKDREDHILTLEDPIEYRLPLIRQTQIKDEIGLSFASGLRTLLRQDPDVILVGETRDQVTAELMIRAALTGHLVFSTLHTNDAISAVPRLTDLGIPPYLLSSSLLGLSAQRLARRLCPICKTEHTLTPEEWVALGGAPVDASVTLHQPVGCQACGQKGYSGRISIAEIIRIDAGLQQRIDDHQPTSKLKRYLKQQGVILMRQDGLMKAQAGLTSIEEVGRVIQLEVGEALDDA